MSDNSLTSRGVGLVVAEDCIYGAEERSYRVCDAIVNDERYPFEGARRFKLRSSVMLDN